MKTIILSLFVLLAGMATAAADQLLIAAIQEARIEAPAQPVRGTTMERVRARYGTPGEMRNAVGDPPISRWDYPGFTVYFEYNRVIHAVVRR